MIYFNVTIKLSINSKSCMTRHSQQMFKMSTICTDTSSWSESTGRRTGLWSCSSVLQRSGNA